MTNHGHLRTLLLTTLLAAACASDPTTDEASRPGSDPRDVPATEPASSTTGGAGAGTAPTAGSTTGDEETTFDHDNTAEVDPFELLAKSLEEGPAEVRARFHSCPKIHYRAIGNLLASRGVDLDNADENSAGYQYRNSDQALGAANYGARIAETTELTTASAAKLFDIFVAAAPEIIANMPSQPQCMLGGVGARMFNDAGQCTAEGITCLTGQPATAAHLELCNAFLGEASTPEQGRIIAVAALAAAAHTCE